MLLDFQGHYDKQTGILLEQISLLRVQLYGRKSEKNIQKLTRMLKKKRFMHLPTIV